MRMTFLLPLLALAGCGSDYQPEVPKAKAETSSGKTATAVFAGGCFWCTEADFEKVPGVTGAVSGYSGGTTSNPTYERVSAAGTGHYEVVQVSYDPARISYPALARYFLRTVDPTDSGGQFCDRGESYRTAIFAAVPAERAAAQSALAEAGKSLARPLATPILPVAKFYPAEAYHQDYYRKNKLKYNFYRNRCGRDARLAEVWGKARN